MSGERGGQGIGPSRAIQRPGNVLSTQSRTITPPTLRCAILVTVDRYVQFVLRHLVKSYRHVAPSHIQVIWSKMSNAFLKFWLQVFLCFMLVGHCPSEVRTSSEVDGVFSFTNAWYSAFSARHRFSYNLFCTIVYSLHLYTLIIPNYVFVWGFKFRSVLSARPFFKFKPPENCFILISRKAYYCITLDIVYKSRAWYFIQNWIQNDTHLV